MAPKRRLQEHRLFPFLFFAFFFQILLRKPQWGVHHQDENPDWVARPVE